MKRLVAFAFVCTTLTVVAHASTIITTYPDWNGTDSIGPFGYHVATHDVATTVGQSFVAPTDDILLQSFQFSVQYVDGDPFSFKFYIGRWDGSKVIGAPIYTSTLQASPSSADANFHDYEVDPGLLLQSGNNYIAFVSTSETKPSSDGTTNLGFVGSPSYHDGGAYYLMNDGDPTKWSGTGWNSDYSDKALAFKAVFINPAAVPEPCTMVVFGTALLGLASRKRLRR